MVHDLLHEVEETEGNQMFGKNEFSKRELCLECCGPGRFFAMLFCLPDTDGNSYG